VAQALQSASIQVPILGNAARCRGSCKSRRSAVIGVRFIVAVVSLSEASVG
jgi:hypothetical protein